MFSFISNSAQQNKINDVIAMNLTALRDACKPPKATLPECAEKTIDYLLRSDLNTQPINPPHLRNPKAGEFLVLIP
ncbi:MAG: hypothetical protein M3R00_03345 [Pseudomonadota bacterium]|nr:hypothetical protein [Pseudomonadota bacterium]